MASIQAIQRLQPASRRVATVELAREQDLDAESVLRAEMMRYRKRIRQVEGL